MADEHEHEEIKVGARNSTADQARLQAAHDAIVAAGAVCNYEPDPEKSVVFYGSEVKALGDGRVGGYLVRYSSANDPDLTGDYFTADTDFGDAQASPVLYHHGLDVKVGKRKLGSGTLRRDEVGVWIDAQLEMRDEYEKAVYALAEKGKLGWSSGTASHLVEREPGGKAAWIKAWPLGLDASLTPTPAEPRNGAMPLKSLLPLEADSPEAEDRPGEGDPAAVAEVKGVQIVSEVSPNKESIMDEQIEQTKAAEVEEAPVLGKGAAIITAKSVNYNKATKLGDDEIKAYAFFLRTGDRGAIKASNNTDMNIGTAADGGDLVPVGHYQGIIAKRDEDMLARKLGVRPIPGKGTSVEVPYDNEDDGEFISTNEAADFDQDAPAVAKHTMTLVKYTKKVTLSYELLNDEDSRLMAFLDDFVGRGMAKTHNSLLITAAGAGGTALKTFASATTYAAGELEAMVYGANISAYLGDSSTAWVTTGPNYGKINALASTSMFLYKEPNGIGGATFAPTLLSFPVHFSNKVATAAASAKSIYFGNWNYMGMREDPGFTVLRDPYSLASKGQVVLHYYFRTVYQVLQAEALGYGVHPTA